MVDADVQLLLNVNVVAPVAPQYSLVAFFDLVHAVTFSTTCDLDFQPYEGNHCKPTIVEINIASEKINQSNFSKKNNCEIQGQAQGCNLSTHSH